MKTCRLIYRSIAESEILDEDSLARLANLAANNNRRFNICGILVLSNGRFLQVIEGQSKFINRLYANIVQDERHHDVELISYEEVSKPEFIDWNMKLFSLDEIDEHVRELLVNKYPVVDNKIQFIDDAVLMTSLLLDIKHLQK